MLYRLSYPSFMLDTAVRHRIDDAFLPFPLCPPGRAAEGRGAKKLDQRGIDPRTSRMLSERSTT